MREDKALPPSRPQFLREKIRRFAMQIGMLPLTGTTDVQHMKEDLAAQNIELSVEEVKLIETLAMR